MFLAKKLIRFLIFFSGSKKFRDAANIESSAALKCVIKNIFDFLKKIYYNKYVIKIKNKKNGGIV